MMTSRETHAAMAISGGSPTGDIRDAVRTWLDRFSVERRAAGDVLLALSELVENARRHGTGGEPSIEVAYDDDAGAADPGGRRVTVAVHNDGDAAEVPAPDRWRQPDRLSLGGRGLAIVAALADRVEVEGDRSTTTVRAVIPLDR